MKKTILTAFSILVFTALVSGGCTSTPKQGKILRHIAGYDCRPDFRSKRCPLATYQPGHRRYKSRMQPVHAVYDKTLTQGAATLTLKDYGLK